MNSDKLYSKCPRVGLVSLGCSKNAVDSEILLGELKSRGFDIVNDAAQAEIIIVNTCGFIESAKTDSIDTILDMAQYKTAGSCKLLVVTGCLSQRYGDELARELPEVDVFNGVKNYPALAERLAEICGVEPAPENANAAATAHDPVISRISAHCGRLRQSLYLLRDPADSRRQSQHPHGDPSCRG